MKLNIPQRAITEWHQRFAWLPTRVSENDVIWLENYLCRKIEIPNNGKYLFPPFHWEYQTEEGAPVWRDEMQF
jgi:hypothetical protein